ncbi:NAD+ synthetase [Caldisphaera lagunensis DSM 15908]|uniref:NH(3)-dependent NAD(+) synthetase n=1 Tax=Caldisphaera lagunensis (strain DSM 15908 / JCM 11604 / ANMR 0165 / IC-154) TaxID=1056495 RepID=L0ADB1_CALLD|nr:NAD+ synthase [Caldisphaera lagunensis]AFZ71040.1 NAD+ synthetase [Caldisphaera lagunensis DSM 15908]
MKITINDVTNIDYEYARKNIEKFIKNELESSRKNGYVVGLSGGVDSALTYYLAAEAVGIEKVFALIMPDTTTTPKEDVNDAKDLVKRLKGQMNVIDISPIVEVYKSTIPIYQEEDNIPLGNVRARIRMTLLYYYANKMSMLVLGTGDRSESFVGYFTKYGDGGVDLLPISSLLKSQVRKLAQKLGVPDNVALKPSSPRLWVGQLAEKELGISYDQIDLIIYSVIDKGYSLKEASEMTGISLDIIQKVFDMNKNSEHKRTFPKSLSTNEVIKYLS